MSRMTISPGLADSILDTTELADTVARFQASAAIDELPQDLQIARLETAAHAQRHVDRADIQAGGCLDA
jgi:hypothetical protein